MIPRITCRELVEFLDAYFEGELPEGDVADFEQHLSSCPPCVAYMKSYRESIRLGRRVSCESPEAVIEDVPEDLVQAILAARPREA